MATVNSSSNHLMIWMVHHYIGGRYAHTVETVFELESAADHWIKAQGEKPEIYRKVRVPLFSLGDVQAIWKD